MPPMSLSEDETGVKTQNYYFYYYFKWINDWINEPEFYMLLDLLI